MRIRESEKLKTVLELYDLEIHQKKLGPDYHRLKTMVKRSIVQDLRNKDATQDSNKHSLIWRMFMSSTLQASEFMGKNYLEILNSIKNTGKHLTMKQMFDISEKLKAEQSDEIYGVNTTNWGDSSWKHLSVIGDKEVISL